MGATCWRAATAAILMVATTASLTAQGPPPVPQPGVQPAPAGTARPPASPSAAETPTEAVLGVPLYPNAVFLRAYDAGRGQRYYLFGVATPFADLVTYYRNILKERGNLVFEVPPTHVFEIGRFREETMAFPPSVTIKDFTFSGSAGYPSPTPGTQPDRFPTVIQIVPPPPGTSPGQ